MEYYYTSSDRIDIQKASLALEDFVYHHLVKVLRKKPGQNISVTDGTGNIFHCQIVEITEKELICRITKTEYNLNEPDIFITLYLSPLRNQSRYEFAIEKAVELGVRKIVPVIFKNTVKKITYNKKNISRIKKIIISAMGQSQRCYLPEFNTEIYLEDLMKYSANERNKFVFYESSNNKSISSLFKNDKNVSIVIGPEGGFDKTEIEIFKESKWKFISLGQRKYRAETAAIIAIFKILNYNN